MKNDAKLEALLKLGMTEEEALQVIADDTDIDHGEAKDFDLTKEQQANAKKYMGTGTRKTSESAKRVRKENPDKREIITMIFDLFRETAIDEDPMENVVMANPERQIDFHYKGESYSITLTQHRKPKG